MKSLSILFLSALLAGFGMGIGVAAAQTDQAPAETAAPPVPAKLDTAPVPAPASADKRKPAEVWADIDASMKNLDQSVEQKKFDQIAGDASNVMKGVRWLIDHPGKLDPTTVRSLEGVEERVKTFGEMVAMEAAKGNAMTTRYSYRRLTETIESARGIYHTPSAAPAKSEASSTPPAPKEAKAHDTADQSTKENKKENKDKPEPAKKK